MSANMADRMETLERAKSDLLDRAADGLDGDVVALLRRYYRHVAGEDVLGRKPEDLLAAALEHRKLAAHRPQGTVTVRVTTPPDETDSRTLPPPSVVEIVVRRHAVHRRLGHRRAQPARPGDPPGDPPAGGRPPGRDG